MEGGGVYSSTVVWLKCWVLSSGLVIGCNHWQRERNAADDVVARQRAKLVWVWRDLVYFIGLGLGFLVLSIEKVSLQKWREPFWHNGWWNMKYRPFETFQTGRLESLYTLWSPAFMWVTILFWITLYIVESCVHVGNNTFFNPSIHWNYILESCIHVGNDTFFESLYTLKLHCGVLRSRE